MAWYHIRERGSIWGIWSVHLMSIVFGYTFTRLFCHFIVGYFFIFSRSSRRHVREFLIRATGQAAYRDIYMTYYRFAESILDRMVILQGKTVGLTCHVHNKELMERLAEAGQGAILLGSHIGPMEASRIDAERRGFKVSVLIYSDISPKLYKLFRKIAPGFENTMIQIKSGSVDYIFEVKQKLDAGQFVAVLGDRVWQTGKASWNDFLGQPAAFPTGPYEMALALGCPILTTFVMKSSKYRYDVYIEELTPGIFAPRAERAVLIEDLQKSYVEKLERFARKTPTQWYNFFDFWERS